MERARTVLETLTTEQSLALPLSRQAQRRDEGRQQLLYSSRPFLLCGLPIKRPPAGTLLHTRQNGRFHLQVQGHAKYGLPFGQDRLIPLWVASLAVRQQQRVIRFSAAADILEEFGLPHSGTYYRRLVEGFKRVFASTVFFGTEEQGRREEAWECARFAFFDRMRIWYAQDGKSVGTAGERFENEIVLSEAFWQEVQAHPIPVERGAVQALANAPGCLEFYMWLVWRCQVARQPQRIPLFGPQGLVGQLGSDAYLRERDFRRTVCRWLSKVKALWPACPVEVTQDGSALLLCPGQAILDMR